MLSQSAIDRANAEMRTMSPEQAWVNATAMTLAENARVGFPSPRSEIEALIGSTEPVVIVNGLVGEDHCERRVSVVVTREMVDAAIKDAANA